MPAPHRSVFYMPDALPATQPTASKHQTQLTTKLLAASFRQAEALGGQRTPSCRASGRQTLM